MPTPTRLLLARGLILASAGLLVYLLHRRRQQRRCRLPPSIPISALPLRLRLLYPLLGHGPLMATPLLLHQLASRYGRD